MRNECGRCVRVCAAMCVIHCEDFNRKRISGEKKTRSNFYRMGNLIVSNSKIVARKDVKPKKSLLWKHLYYRALEINTEMVKKAET